MIKNFYRTEKLGDKIKFIVNKESFIILCANKDIRQKVFKENKAVIQVVEIEKDFFNNYFIPLYEIMSKYPKKYYQMQENMNEIELVIDSDLFDFLTTYLENLNFKKYKVDLISFLREMEIKSLTEEKKETPSKKKI